MTMTRPLEPPTAVNPLNETTGIRRAPRLELPIDSVEFHLFRPRTSRHPMLRAAYELWRSEWQATLSELDGTRRLHSDEFGRLDEVLVLSLGQRCVALTGLRWLDFSLPMAKEDSYFQHWPEDVMRRVGRGLVCIIGNAVIHAGWRQAVIDPSPERSGTPALLAQTTLALGFRRFMESPAEHLIGVARNDRSMNRLAAAVGAEKIGQIRLHNIDSDLMILRRDRAKVRGPVYDVLWNRRCLEHA